MRRLSVVTLAAAAALLVSPALAADMGPPVLRASAPAYEPAPPPEGGWYLRGDIGVAANTIGDFGVFDGAQRLGSAQGFELRSKSFSETVSIGIGAGYQFNSWFRVDVTGEFRGGGRLRGYDYVAFASGGGTTHQTNNYQGDVRSWAMMANFYVDLGTYCTFGCLTPYLGAGVGFAHHTVSGFSDTSTGFNTVLGATGSLGSYAVTSSKTTFAWALMAGVGYRVSERLSLELGYRYLNMGSLPVLSLINNDPTVIENRSVRVRNVSAHEIRLGMRWMLNCACAPAAPIVARY